LASCLSDALPSNTCCRNIGQFLNKNPQHSPSATTSTAPVMTVQAQDMHNHTVTCGKNDH
jgi:hypothetical protein